MAEDFGSYLKAERELRGVTLEELHTKTKIPTHYLQALEKNQFDELPEEVFIKGYIRSFAKVIGANEDELLSAYIDLTKDLTKTTPPTNTNYQSNLNQNNFTFDPKFIFILIFIILFLSGAVWGVNILIRKFNMNSAESNSELLQQKQNETKEEVKSKLPSKTSAIDSKTTIKESSNSLSVKPVAALESSSPAMNDENTSEKLKLHSGATSRSENISETSTLFTGNDTPLKLTIKVKNDVWFSIAVDDSPIEDFVLAKGSEKIFYGKKQYLLNVGNQNLVDLILNDTVVNFPKENKEGVVTNFTINSQLVE